MKYVIVDNFYRLIEDSECSLKFVIPHAYWFFQERTMSREPKSNCIA